MGWVVFLFVALSSALAAESGPSPETARRQYDLYQSPAARMFFLQPFAKQLEGWSENGQPVPRRFSLPASLPSRGRAAVLEEDSVCYFVRSYRVARPSRDSDVTVPVGYVTCTPSTKFQVKRADRPPR